MAEVYRFLQPHQVPQRVGVAAVSAVEVLAKRAIQACDAQLERTPFARTLSFALLAELEWRRELLAREQVQGYEIQRALAYVAGGHQFLDKHGELFALAHAEYDAYHARQRDAVLLQPLQLREEVVATQLLSQLNWGRWVDIGTFFAYLFRYIGRYMPGQHVAAFIGSRHQPDLLIVPCSRSVTCHGARLLQGDEAATYRFRVGDVLLVSP